MTLGLAEIVIVVVIIAFLVGFAFRAGIVRGRRK